MRKLVLLLVGVLFFNSASAAEYFRGRTITGVGVFYSGAKSILFITIDGDKSSMSPCANSKRFAIDSNTPNFKEMVSAAMTAYATKDKKVDLIVNKTCNHWGNSQDLLGIKIGDMHW